MSHASLTDSGKSGNILNYLPKSIQTKARADLQEIWMGPSRAEAEKAIALFREKYQDKYPKAVSCLTKDTNSLLAFFDFPAVHWSHYVETAIMLCRLLKPLVSPGIG